MLNPHRVVFIGQRPMRWRLWTTSTGVERNGARHQRKLQIALPVSSAGRHFSLSRKSLVTMRNAQMGHTVA